MKLCGSKHSFPRSLPVGPSFSAGAALAFRSAMTGGWVSALRSGASPAGVTTGTVGPGPKARDEVFASASAPGVLALALDRLVASSYSEHGLPCAAGYSPSSRSVEAMTRLETRTKESNMYTSRWVD